MNPQVSGNTNHSRTLYNFNDNRRISVYSSVLITRVCVYYAVRM
jgi:hypothetical protein